MQKTTFNCRVKKFYLYISSRHCMILTCVRLSSLKHHSIPSTELYCRTVDFFQKNSFPSKLYSKSSIQPLNDVAALSREELDYLLVVLLTYSVIFLAHYQNSKQVCIWFLFKLYWKDKNEFGNTTESDSNITEHEEKNHLNQKCFAESDLNTEWHTSK